MKIFFTILIAVSVNCCIGQTDTILTTPKFILGVNTGTMIHGMADALDYFAHFTIEKKKHFLAVGPIVGLKLKMDGQYSEDFIAKQYRLNGLHIVYQINPNPKGKRFDFYFQNEFIFLYYIDKGIGYVQVYYPAIHLVDAIPQSYKSHLACIEDYIGYGFKVKFLKNFYFNQSIGIGILHSAEAINYEDATYNIRSNDTNPGVILKMGLGYTFKNK